MPRIHNTVSSIWKTSIPASPPLCGQTSGLNSPPPRCWEHSPLTYSDFVQFLKRDFRYIGPSSSDCTDNFAQASSQHKFTMTSHLTYDNVHTVLSCPAWLEPLPPYERFSNPWLGKGRSCTTIQYGR